MQCSGNDGSGSDQEGLGHLCGHHLIPAVVWPPPPPPACSLQVDALVGGAGGAGVARLSHAFVARFLEKWAAEAWDKGFLDKVRGSNPAACCLIPLFVTTSRGRCRCAAMP
jgi:hypothetical protein